MRCGAHLALAAGVVLALAFAGNSASANDLTGANQIEGCITAAANLYRVPPAVLVILLNVEGGSLGRVSSNQNGTVDIGPMQVNLIWLPDLAKHWHASRADTFQALRDNFCANVEAGAWILRRGLDQAPGDFWQGVGYYHSHNPALTAVYLRLVLNQAERLQNLAAGSASTEGP